MNEYVGQYRDDTVEYIKEHLEQLDREIEKYESAISGHSMYMALLQAKSNALIALANICAKKELD
jgi:prefoldin subunit 5